MRSILHHLHSLPLLALFGTVLGYHVKLPNLVLQSNHMLVKVDDSGLVTSSTVIGIQILYSLTNIVTQLNHFQSLGHQSENFDQNSILIATVTRDIHLYSDENKNFCPGLKF